MILDSHFRFEDEEKYSEVLQGDCVHLKSLLSCAVTFGCFEVSEVVK